MIITVDHEDVFMKAADLCFCISLKEFPKVTKYSLAVYCDYTL